MMRSSAELPSIPRHLRLVERRGDVQALPEPPRLGPFFVGVETDRAARPWHIPASARPRHLYVTGMPGTGKSTLLLNLVRHDIASGTGCCLIDPHGGLVDAILETCRAQSSALDRFVIVDAADPERPVGIDLLHTRNEHEQDLAVQFFLSLFNRMYLAEHQGPVFMQAARNGLLLLMQAGRTLAELPLIFADEAYLRRLLQRPIDPFVRRYFERIWLQQTAFHRSESLSYILSKFSPFLEDRNMRSILSQRGGLDLDAAMAQGKVVLINLARGRLGDVNADVLGQILLHSIRRSAMRRNPSSEPSLFNLYVDEAHEFSGPELCELMTAMRKFGVGVTLANQSLDDFPFRVRDTLMGSTGTLVILRQGPGFSVKLETLLSPRFDRRDLTRLPDFTAVISTTGAGGYVAPQAVRLQAPPRARDRELAAAIRERSAACHGRPRAEVEAELLRVVDGKEEEETVCDESTVPHQSLQEL